MSLSKFFVDRPIFAGVISIAIFLAGLIAMFRLPISEYPEVVPPSVVVVSASVEALSLPASGPSPSVSSAVSASSVAPISSPHRPPSSAPLILSNSWFIDCQPFNPTDAMPPISFSWAKK